MEKKAKKGLKIAVLSLCGLLCGAVAIAPNSIATKAETGADSTLQTGAYFWAQGGELVYHMKNVEENEHTLSYYFSSTLPHTIYNRYYLTEPHSQTNRVTYFKDLNGNDNTPSDPYEEILYTGLYNTNIQLVTPRNNEATASYKWVLESATLQIKGRKVIDLDYFLNSIRETMFAIIGRPKRAIGQLTLVNFDTAQAELNGIDLSVDYNNNGYSYFNGNALAEAIENRVSNYARDGENGRRYIILDTFFLNFTTTIDPKNYTKPTQFYISYQPYNNRVDNNTVVLSTEKAPFTIEWNGEIGLWKFVDTFFSTELFPGFNFATLLFISVGGLMIGMLLKIFIGG